MRITLHEAMMKLLESTNQNAGVTVKHLTKDNRKSFTAKMSLNDTGGPSISLRSFQGYNEKYLSSRITFLEKELNNYTRADLQNGDIVLTRQLINNPPSPGTVITLGASTYYYSVNGGVLTCNGEQFGSSIQAEFIKLIDARCNAVADTATYSQFKLR